MRRPLRPVLLLATAAFSECGPRPAEVRIEGPGVVRAEAVGDSLYCPVDLTTRLGYHPDPVEAEWAESRLRVLTEATGQVVAEHAEDAAATAAHWDAPRIRRNVPVQGRYRIGVAENSIVYLDFGFRTLGRESPASAGPRGFAVHAFRCGVWDAPPAAN